MSTNRASDAPEELHTTGIYVYGIVPADVETEEDAVGVCDGPVRLVRHGDIAALVSDISVDRPLGKPVDLQAMRTFWTALPVWRRFFRFGSGRC